MSNSDAKKKKQDNEPEISGETVEGTEPVNVEASGAPDFSSGVSLESVQEAAIYYGLAYAGYIVLLLVLAGLSFAAWRTSKENAETGENNPTIFKKLSASLSFVTKEDTRPLVEKLPWTKPKYVFLAAIPVIAVLAWPLNWNIPIAVIVIVLCSISWKRYGDVQLAREHALNQLFEIARERLRYKGSADRVKDQYIQISEWKDMVIPSSVIIMYPSSSPVSKDEFRYDFEMHLTSQAIAGVVWDFEWEYANNRVIITAQPPLPTMAYLPFPTVGEFEWNTLPLGVGVNGEPLVWSVSGGTSIPHSVIAGKSGSGKSVLQRNILIHALQQPEWNVILIDPKRVELSMYKDADAVVKYAVSEETMNEALEFALEEMSNRYTIMEREGVAFYRKLENPPNALMVMIDEAASLLLETGDRDIDTLKKRNKVIVGRLAREGRAAGVHLVLATQRPDAKWLGGDTRETIEGRGAMGNMSSSASLMILNNVMATRTPGVKGRGIWFDGNDYNPMQSYFFEDSDVALAIPYCNGLRDGSIDPVELRNQLYPDSEGGKPDSDGFGRGGGGGVFQRLGAWFGAQAEKSRNAADEEGDDSDEGSSFNYKEWIAAKKSKKGSAEPEIDYVMPVEEVFSRPERPERGYRGGPPDSASAEDIDSFYEQLLDSSSGEVDVEGPAEPEQESSPMVAGGNLSDTDIASLDRLLREMKEDGP